MLSNRSVIVAAALGAIPFLIFNITPSVLAALAVIVLTPVGVAAMLVVAYGAFKPVSPRLLRNSTLWALALWSGLAAQVTHQFLQGDATALRCIFNLAQLVIWIFIANSIMMRVKDAPKHARVTW